MAPIISRKPDPQSFQGLARFIKQELVQRNISMRAAASGIGISHSHLSDILSRKKTPDAGVCNAIALYFNKPQVEVYRLAGWLSIQSAPSSNVFAKRDADGSLAIYTRREEQDEDTLLVVIRIRKHSSCENDELAQIQRLCVDFVYEETGDDANEEK